MTIKIPKDRSTRTRVATVLAWAFLPAAGAAVLSAGIPQPVFLWNATPSEPVGLYVRSGAMPGPGAIIAFRAPAEAFPYADARMGYLRRIPILKSVAAGEGERVCTVGGALTINGRPRAPVQTHDVRGMRLPVWHGCRVLATGEFFVFSDLVPNSFDSRYYGPVGQRAIVGVYRPLLIAPGGVA